MPSQNRKQLNEFMSHIEENWDNLQILFDELAASGGWDQRHGPDWTFADLPYHLAYCNDEILIRGLKVGASLPEGEQDLLASPEAINDWNARKFAERPAGQTAGQSVAQWRATCQEIRRLAANMDDADLEKPFWMPLMAGWTTAVEGFEFTRTHDWSEFMQLRIHMERDEPVPSAGATRAYLNRILQFFPLFLDREAAAGREFNAVMAFSDPQVGAFTIRVVDGNATVAEGADQDADLVMTQSVETFEKTLRGIQKPAEAMGSGEIQVSDFEGLAVFGKLFPMG